jgi:hypothetical protein
MNLRKWIHRIHLYGGLLCFWYLIIFAVSSLQFQHHFEFMTLSGGKEIVNERKIEIQGNNDKLIFARNLQDKLNIAGWLIPWQTSLDSAGLFHTVIQNPKSRYTLVYNPSTYTVKMSEAGNGFLRIINSLHGYSGNMPNAPLLVFWKIFTYVCVIIVVFSIFSGIWLWAVKKGNKLTGWITFSGILVLSFLLMIIVYIYG